MEPLKQTKEYLAEKGLEIEDVLLHACCGPCAEAPILDLWEAGVEITLYYYNPNIYPEEEWERRKEAIMELAELRDVDLIIEKGDREKLQIGLEKLKKQCGRCYQMRLDKAAQKAKEDGHASFSTTLLVSPFQNREALVKIGEKLAAEHGVEFLAVDWRPLFRLGQNLAKEHGLYRQKYCACWQSLMESKYKDEILEALKEIA